MEGDEVHHEGGLQQPDGGQRGQAEQGRVEVAGGQVDHLGLGGGLGKAVVEGQHGQGDGAKAGEDEQKVVQPVTDIFGDWRFKNQDWTVFSYISIRKINVEIFKLR